MGDTLTSLWSGCGSIVECMLDAEPCVIKAIKIPRYINHPKIKQSEFALKESSSLIKLNIIFIGYTARTYRQALKVLPVLMQLMMVMIMR
eukprot:UN25495